MSPPVIVVGASMAGLRSAEQLRAQGWKGPLVVVGEEPYAPYNRPPLSKQALTQHRDQDPEKWLSALAFRPRAGVADVRWRLGARAVATDLDAHSLHLDDGAVLEFSGLVVATGVRPRRLPVPGPRLGRYVLRNLDDARALASRLDAGARVVVVGAGFIGCELAATAVALGCRVVLVEAAPAPLVRVLGDELGHAIGRHHQSRGVEVRCGRGVTALLPARDDADRVGAVELDDGSVVPADVVVEAIGSVPNVEWLDGNGLDLGDGLLCDRNLRALGRPDVVAAGDVARVANPRFDAVPRRVEHWCMPAATARQAASSLLGHLTHGDAGPAGFAPMPSFWSDQHDLRLQSFGHPFLADSVELVEGDLDRLDTGTIVHYRRDGRLVGVLMTNVEAARQQLQREALDRACPAPAPTHTTGELV